MIALASLALTDVEVATVVIMLGVAMGLITFLWLVISFDMAADWRERLDDLLAEMDELPTTFGVGAGRQSGEVCRGVVASARTDKLLVAPLSRRPCVAYRIAKGFAVSADLILVYNPSADSLSVPFSLDDGTSVSLDGRFRFSVASVALRAEFLPKNLPPESLREFSYTRGGFGRTEKKLFRLYEWILPVGAECAIAGKGIPTRDYRSTSELHIKDAQILLTSPSDPGAIQRLERSRVEIAKLKRRIRIHRRVAIPVGTVAFAYAGWIIWYGLVVM